MRIPSLPEVSPAAGGDRPLHLEYRRYPFSRRGSYLSLGFSENHRAKGPGLFLRHVHRGSFSHLARLEPSRDGIPLPYSVTLTPGELACRAEGGRIRFCFPGGPVVLARAEGLSLLLSLREDKWNHALPARGPGAGKGLRLNLSEQRTQLYLEPRRGILRFETRAGDLVITVTPAPGEEAAELRIEEIRGGWTAGPFGPDFDAASAEAAAEFEAWSRDLAGPHASEDQRRAAYVAWCCLVAPRGHFRREAMLMSKHVMTQVWSWDHAFNALALARAFPALAWDQFMLPFDHQDPTGALPDSVNDEFRIWNFCKMPVHGWLLDLLIRRNPELGAAHRLAEIHGPLAAWTRWWLRYRDDEGQGLCAFHHGNDSGWDNATVFDAPAPVQAPPLSAFLVLQCEFLARSAAQLGRAEEAEEWQGLAGRILAALLQTFRVGNRLHSISLPRGEHLMTQGLFDYQVLVLGKRLPAEVRQALIADLAEEGRFLGPFGLATESLRSPLYEDDGYWRGSVWAPACFILHRGLLECGEASLARLIADRFRAAAAGADFCECLDAKTGRPQRDLAYTWTASVHLLFAEAPEEAGE